MVPYRTFLDDLGKSSVTGWRMRRDGLVNTINISGKIYIRQQEIQRFEERAAAGEFARVPHVPRRGDEVVS